MSEKYDLRVIKTKKNLYESLIELMQEKRFEKIKVSDICNKALINRSTFYSHYEDKYELLLDLFENQKNLLLANLNNSNNVLFSKEYILEFLDIIIDQIEKNRKIFNAIIVNNQNGIFMDFLLDGLEIEAYNKLKEKKDAIKSSIPINFIVKFYLGGIINVATSLILKNKTYDKETLLLYFSQLIQI